MDGANVYTDDAGVIIVRASAFGQCERKLWAAFDGVQPMEHKDTTLRAFKEGHLHEAAVVEQRTQEGYLIESDQAEVVLKILPNKLHIVGHIDGVISELTSEYDPRLWECKSMSRAAFDDWVVGRWDYRPGYKWQLAIYMLGMSLDKAWYDVKRRDDGFIDTWLIDELPYSKAEIRSRALMLHKMFKSGEMPPCTGEGGAKWFCEYWFLHDEETISIDSPDDGPIDNVPELDEMMGAYYEAANTETWARKERGRLKAEITEKYLSGRDVIRTEHHVLKITDGTSTRFDKAALSAEIGQEIVDKFTKKTPTKVWKIDTRKGS